MRCLLSVFFATHVIFFAASLHAQASLGKAADVDALLSAPAVEVRFNQAPLREVVRGLADVAGIPFIGLPPGPHGDVLIDLSVKANPFTLLRAVASEHGYVVTLRDGVWRFEKEAGSGLLAVVYPLRHINGDSVQQNATANAQSQTPTTSAGALPPMVSNSFKATPDRMIADIQLLVGAQSGEVAEKKAGAIVIYNADTNALFVLATTQQHAWVREYLEAIDRPRALILLETRFVELSNNPEKDYGLDWFGSLEGGVDVGVRDPEGLAASSGGGVVGALTPGDFTSRLSSSAILSAEQLRVSLRAFATDSRSRNVQQPRQVTLSNREVVLRSVLQVPFESGSSSVTGGASSTSSTATTFIPVGTTINLLPRVLDGKNVELSILINVSDIVGEKIIGRSRVPMTSSRDFTGQAIVTSGNTLAIGGLERMVVTQSTSRVPIMSDVPLLGLLFRRQQSSDDRSKLLMFITPTILGGYSGGVGSAPEIDAAVVESSKSIDGK